MKFTQDQIDSLITRLRQTKEELLFDFETNKVQDYSHIEREGKILGVAHCDFVESAWSYPVQLDHETVQAGQVDDRVGVWLLLDILPKIKGMPKFDILLTNDEETGNSTAKEAAREKNLDYNWTFQFDRHGTGFVDYDMSTPEFISDFSNTTGLTIERGTFSDICYLPDSCGSRVNVGTAYYQEHHPDAWVDLTELAKQVEKFVMFAKRYANKQYPAKYYENDPYADDTDLWIIEMEEKGNLASLPADTDIQTLRDWMKKTAKENEHIDLSDNDLLVD